jgi:hypothetical protein
MSSDTDLSHQPGITSQQPLTEKKKNSSWKIFSTLLIILNLLFLFLSYITFLLPLAIIDFIAISSYIKKQSPPWKVFLISLLVFNVIFFLGAVWTLNQSAGAVAGIIIIPAALILVLIDSIGILSYIYIRLPNARAKFIFYTALVSIVLGILTLSIFSSAHP